jgi:hypothetical protein
MMVKKKADRGTTDIIKKLERRVKRFEKIEKKFQQPWRNCGEEDMKAVNDIIKHFNKLIRDVRKGMATGPINLVLKVYDLKAWRYDTELKIQNMLKSQDKEIHPFGKQDIIDLYYKAFDD